MFIIEDQSDSALNNKALDHCCRIISRKRNLSLIIITQNYFSAGRYSRDIRNSCYYTALLRNFADDSINKRASRSLGLIKAFESSYEELENSKHPLIFINQSPKGQTTPYRFYIELFGKIKKVYSKIGMPAYIISGKDFLSQYIIKHQNGSQIIAEIKNDNQKGFSKDIASNKEATSLQETASIPQKRQESRKVDTEFKLLQRKARKRQQQRRRDARNRQPFT